VLIRKNASTCPAAAYTYIDFLVKIL